LVSSSRSANGSRPDAPATSSRNASARSRAGNQLVSRRSKGPRPRLDGAYPVRRTGFHSPGYALGPHARRLDGHAAGALQQEKLGRDVFGRAEFERLGPHADDAVAQAALQRAEALPFEPVDRVAGRMRLRHDVAGKLLAPVVVVALGARHVDLAL